MLKIFEKIKNLFKRKPKEDLRQKCIEAYGEEFGDIYDSLNSGIPVGGFAETAIIIEMIEAVKRGEPVKLKRG